MNTERLMINNSCKFHYGDEPDAWQAWFEDKDWEDVALPHDWSVHMPFSKDYSSGTGYLAGGIGWYRIHVAPKKEWEGKKISITFDGVYKNSRVWVNSYYMGERPNGYISFTYDITEQFKFDDDNVICVYVDRREIADSRWFTGSGILGKVYITVEEQIHPAKYGVFFTTPVANKEIAIWEVKTTWLNESDDEAKLSVVYRLLDDKGEAVDSIESTIVLFPDDETEHTVSSTMENPVLWTTENPYLYTLSVVAMIDDKECEVYREKVGLRTIRFDADKGFFLNEEPTLFKGVCLHHDAGVLGGAVPPAVWYHRLTKLKKMGCNAIRMSHNPHVPELYDLCDSLGFLVMDEAFDEWEGPKNKWHIGHNVYPPKNYGYYVNFHTWGKKDLADMVLRDRNHPSIVMWSTGNEIDYPNDPYCNAAFKESTGNNDANKPAAERLYNPKRPDAKRLSKLAAMLTDVVKSVDDTRPVTLAASFPELSVSLGFIDSLDVVGFNYRENLYEENHKAYPDKPFLGSENGHGLNQWKAVTDNEYISGQFLWTGIDYLGECKGWPVHGSSAGLINVGGFEKPGYFRRQSFWSGEPMVHMATVTEAMSKETVWGQKFDDPEKCEFSTVNECWNYAEGESVVVKCYTNMNSVELFINGKSVGKKEKKSDVDCVLFTVKYEAGQIKAVAYDKAGNATAEDALKTTKSACKYVVERIDVPSDELPLLKTIAPDCTDAFNDMVRFDITLEDEDGNRDYLAENLIKVSVKNGKLLGLESGNLADVTDYFSDSRKAYRGQLVAYVMADKKGDKPEIEVTI